jgi:hypothetical protein
LPSNSRSVSHPSREFWHPDRGGDSQPNPIRRNGPVPLENPTRLSVQNGYADYFSRLSPRFWTANPAFAFIHSGAARGRLTLPYGGCFGGRGTRFPVPAPRKRNAGESRGFWASFFGPDTVHPFSEPRSILRISIVEGTTLLVEITGSGPALRQIVVAGQPLLGCCPKEGRRSARIHYPGQTLPKSPQAMTALPKVRGFEDEVLFWIGEGIPPHGSEALRSGRTRKLEVFSPNCTRNSKPMTRQLNPTRMSNPPFIEHNRIECLDQLCKCIKLCGHVATG